MKNYEKAIIRNGIDQLRTHVLESPGKEFKVLAILAKKKKIIDIAFNETTKTDTFQSKYCDNPYEIYRHAETTVIKKVISRLKKTDLGGLTIYVIRLKWLDDTKRELILGNSFPCKTCFSCIMDHNISELIYSSDNQTFQKEVYNNGSREYGRSYCLQG